MTEPIIVHELESLGWRKIDHQYTYEDLLELFDDSTIVRPLVLRCQKYEEEITRLKGLLREAADAMRPFADFAANIHESAVDSSHPVFLYERLPSNGDYRRASEVLRKIEAIDDSDGH